MINKKLPFYLGCLGIVLSCATQEIKPSLSPEEQKRFAIGAIAISAIIGSTLTGSALYAMGRNPLTKENILPVASVGILSASLVAGLIALFSKTALERFKDLEYDMLAIEQRMSQIHKNSFNTQQFSDKQLLMNTIIANYTYSTNPVATAFYDLRNKEDEIKWLIRDIQEFIGKIQKQYNIQQDNPLTIGYKKLMDNGTKFIEQLNQYHNIIKANAVFLRESYYDHIKQYEDEREKLREQASLKSLEERKIKAQENIATALNKQAEAEKDKVQYARRLLYNRQ